jgi:hypothetical protein
MLLNKQRRRWFVSWDMTVILTTVSDRSWEACVCHSHDLVQIVLNSQKLGPTFLVIGDVTHHMPDS